jgi:hypothetical protein
MHVASDPGIGWVVTTGDKGRRFRAHLYASLSGVIQLNCDNLSVYNNDIEHTYYSHSLIGLAVGA